MSIKKLFNYIYKSIYNFRRNLFSISKLILKRIKNNKLIFLSLILINLFNYLMMAILLIFGLTIPSIIYAESIFIYLIIYCLIIAFLIGIQIGYTKIILNYIDGKQIKLISLFQYFNLLPKIILMYCAFLVIPITLILYIIIQNDIIISEIFEINHNFTFDKINETGLNNINSFSGLDKLAVGSIDFLLISLLVISYVWFLCKFWTVRNLLIDKKLSFIKAFKKSYKMNSYNALSFIMIFLISSLLLSVFNQIITNVLIVQLGYIWGINEIYLVIVSSSYLLWNMFWILYYRKLAILN